MRILEKTIVRFPLRELFYERVTVLDTGHEICMGERMKRKMKLFID
jgi:hypothetical protein